MKATFNTVGRDEIGNLLKNGEGRDWSGVLINLSISGARMQVPSTVHAHKGDACKLKFDLEGYVLVVPGEIAHITHRHDSFLYGMKVKLTDDENSQAYRQLIDLVALGALLKPTKPTQPDEASGYLVEQYIGEESCQLDVWREYAGRTIVAFDFRLRNYRVRGLSDRPTLEYFLESESAGTVVPAPAAQGAEIQRLFHWVVPNIGNAVPEDVRNFLQKFAG
jgi:Tfp pilus assembly protein PilZ